MSRYRILPVDDLIVDDRYQRPLDERRIKRIADNFDNRLFGVLEVSRRDSNGHAAVFDGQHRLMAAMRRGITEVPCLVHDDLAPEDEARYFVDLQRGRKNVSPVEKLHAAAFSGDPEAEGIVDTVWRHGYEIGKRTATVRHVGGVNNIGAVGALQRLYRLGMLDTTLSYLRFLWDQDYKATDGYIIEGLGLFLYGYRERLEARDDRIERLREAAPVDILRRALGRMPGTTRSSEGIAQAVAAELVRLTGVRGKPKDRGHLPKNR